MRALLAVALLLTASWALAEDASPTIRTALDAADAATADDLPLDTKGLDANEVALRDLEFRVDKMRSSRGQMQQALMNMGADSTVDPSTRRIFCQAAVPALRAPDFFKLLHGKVKTLEKPKNFAQLTPEQVERLTGVKVKIAELQAQPDMDCSKI